MKAIRITSLMLLLITSINALIAGYKLMTDPSGATMNLTQDLLHHSPFSTFLIPGITLFFIIGIFSLMAALTILFDYKGMPHYVRIQGGLIIGWIIMQIIFLHLINILHLFILTIGIILFIFGAKMNRSKEIILDPSEQFDD